jgi:hypothetical protein
MVTPPTSRVLAVIFIGSLHEMKVTTLTAGGCLMSEIPHRGGEPYLWEEFILWLGDGRVAVAFVDDHQRSPFSQAKNFSQRFSPILRFLPASSELLIITGSDARERIYERILQHPDVKRAHGGGPIPVKTYQVEPSTKTFAQADPISSYNRERIPTKDRPRSSVWSTNLATIR